MKVITNYNQPKVKSQNFGRAHIIMREDHLLLNSATIYEDRQNYVVPLKKLWKEMKKTHQLKEEMRKAPKEVEVDFTAIKTNPGSFYVSVSNKKGSNRPYSTIITSTEMPKDGVAQLTQNLAKAIQSMHKH